MRRSSSWSRLRHRRRFRQPVSATNEVAAFRGVEADPHEPVDAAFALEVAVGVGPANEGTDFRPLRRRAASSVSISSRCPRSSGTCGRACRPSRTIRSRRRGMDGQVGVRAVEASGEQGLQAERWYGIGLMEGLIGSSSAWARSAPSGSAPASSKRSAASSARRDSSSKGRTKARSALVWSITARAASG